MINICSYLISMHIKIVVLLDPFLPYIIKRTLPSSPSAYTSLISHIALIIVIDCTGFVRRQRTQLQSRSRRAALRGYRAVQHVHEPARHPKPVAEQRHGWCPGRHDAAEEFKYCTRCAVDVFPLIVFLEAPQRPECDRSFELIASGTGERRRGKEQWE